MFRHFYGYGDFIVDSFARLPVLSHFSVIFRNLKANLGMIFGDFNVIFTKFLAGFVRANANFQTTQFRKMLENLLKKGALHRIVSCFQMTT